MQRHPKVKVGTSLIFHGIVFTTCTDRLCFQFTLFAPRWGTKTLFKSVSSTVSFWFDRMRLIRCLAVVMNDKPYWLTSLCDWRLNHVMHQSLLLLAQCSIHKLVYQFRNPSDVHVVIIDYNSVGFPCCPWESVDEVKKTSLNNSTCFLPRSEVSLGGWWTCSSRWSLMDLWVRGGWRNQRDRSQEGMSHSHRCCPGCLELFSSESQQDLWHSDGLQTPEHYQSYLKDESKQRGVSGPSTDGW